MKTRGQTAASVAPNAPSVRIPMTAKVVAVTRAGER
jgi:hypothetical protein